VLCPRLTDDSLRCAVATPRGPRPKNDSDEGEESPAPVWFEHKAFLHLDNPWVFIPVYITLCAAPIVMVLPEVIELLQSLGILVDERRADAIEAGVTNHTAAEGWTKQFHPAVFALAIIGHSAFIILVGLLFHELRTSILRGAHNNKILDRKIEELKAALFGQKTSSNLQRQQTKLSALKTQINTLMRTSQDGGVDSNTQQDKEERFTVVMLDKLKMQDESEKRTTCKRLFKVYDVDDSGSITFLELESALTNLGLGLSDVQLREIFADMDANNSGRVTLDEFTTWFTENGGNIADERAQEIRIKAEAREIMAGLQTNFGRRQRTMSAGSGSRHEEEDELTNSPDDCGPFTHLAWNGPRCHLRRVELTAMYQVRLRVAGAIAAMFCLLGLSYAVWRTVTIIRDPRRIKCLTSNAQIPYAVASIVVEVPATVLASFIIPIWFVSLMLGAYLAADDVFELMAALNPRHVEKFTGSGAAEYWRTRVQQPGVYLVTTMEELSKWGPSTAYVFVVCLLSGLCMFPHAIASKHVVLVIAIVCSLFVPVLVATPPATVSEACDTMYEQLNDIAFLGDTQHKNRCFQLRKNWKHMNRNHGLGFVVFRIVLDKKMLWKIAGIIAGFATTIFTSLLALSESFSESD
jgi:Ca2+-binding EF-hand superfamily protein